eukprot:SAG11_NODE_1814_length_4218_cov_2.964797_2_plen_179_part_00
MCRLPLMDIFLCPTGAMTFAEAHLLCQEVMHHLGESLEVSSTRRWESLRQPARAPTHRVETCVRDTTNRIEPYARRPGRRRRRPPASAASPRQMKTPRRRYSLRSKPSTRRACWRRSRSRCTRSRPTACGRAFRAATVSVQPHCEVLRFGSAQVITWLWEHPMGRHISRAALCLPWQR